MDARIAQITLRIRDAFKPWPVNRLAKPKVDEICERNTSLGPTINASVSTGQVRVIMRLTI